MSEDIKNTTVAVPDGWQLVPIEPTEAMINAAHKNNFARCMQNGPLNTYSAMLSAAPKYEVTC